MFLKKLGIYFFLTGYILKAFVFGQYYLNDGVFKFVAGVDLPLDVKVNGGSLGWFTNVEVAYDLPNNITYYEPYKVLQKRSIKNTLNRYIVYQAMEKYFDRLGISGEQCIYRIICESARRKINRDRNGLVGEIMHILFSPDKDVHPGLEKHKLARQHGLYNNTDCGDLYNDCLLHDNSILLKL